MMNQDSRCQCLLITTYNIGSVSPLIFKAILREFSGMVWHRDSKEETTAL